MNVTRLHDGGSSWIEPELDPNWSDLQKLEWHAAVVAHDTGLDLVKVTKSDYRVGGIPMPGYFCIQIGYGHSIAPLSFRQSWSYLNGVARGAVAHQHAT